MIGIIGAMDIEINGLRERMTGAEVRTVSGIEFTEGELCGARVVTAVCGIGKVNAAMCAQTMIMVYGPDKIINTGVAGALSPELNVGDIVISDAVVEHDMDTTAIGDEPGLVLINNRPTVRIPADAALTETLGAAAEACEIKHLIGTVASGDQFVSTSETKTAIAQKFGAMACEMEGAAIGHVCCANGVPFAVVRAISDSLTDGSAMEYGEFKYLAADMSNKLVLRYLVAVER